VNFTRPSLRQLFYSFSKRKMSTDSLEMKNRLVWVDLEMTGLDDNIHHIIEAACLITDKDLNIVAEGPNVIIHQPEEILNLMDDWCTKTHGESGLSEAVRKSTVSIEMARQEILNFVKEHTLPGQSVLAGNSVGEDKRFLLRYMPQLIKHLHYRIVDVSSVKELCRRWYPEVLAHAPVKSLKHRAMDDIRESIDELKFYRNEIFKS